jgi:hypothetical protein
LTASRKLPLLEPLTEFFWTAGADGHLRIQGCGACGHLQHPPLVRCPVCHSADLAPRVVSGQGRVRSYTVNAQAWQREMDEPFVFAVIELDEQPGLYVFSNLVCPPDQARSGLRVAVIFEQQEDVWLPLFRPVESEHG